MTRFVAALAESRGSLDTFVVTLPKVTSTEQVAAFVHAASTLEDELGLADKAIRFEIQVETPQSVLGPDGTALVARMVHAAGGRLTALHYGTYDYSAFCGIAAEQQSLEHPVADHAKLVMQAAAAGTGVRLSDGSTNVLPVGDADDVHAAWLNHHRLVTRSLEHGFYQGWDLHPGQLPTRYAATYAFFRTGLPRALDPARRLHREEELGSCGRHRRRTCDRARPGRLRAARSRLRRRRRRRGARGLRTRRRRAAGARAPLTAARLPPQRGQPTEIG